MRNEGVSMSKLKQLIALQASNLSVRAITRALGLSRLSRSCIDGQIAAPPAAHLGSIETWFERAIDGPDLESVFE